MHLNRLANVSRMSKIQLIDLDTSSDEEETGGMVISRKAMRGRLGWLSTIVEPDTKRQMDAMEGIENVQEMHKEDQVQGTHEDQLSHALMDALETTRITKNENVGKSKEEKEAMENPTQFENTETLKDDFAEAGGERKDVIERRVESELMETVKEEKEETNKEQDNTIEERKIMQLATIETAQQIATAETKTDESDTRVEENEEAILPEDGILLTYVEKQSCTNEETETTKV